jgi:hypothetical protein
MKKHLEGDGSERTATIAEKRGGLDLVLDRCYCFTCETGLCLRLLRVPSFRYAA